MQPVGRIDYRIPGTPDARWPAACAAGHRRERYGCGQPVNCGWTCAAAQRTAWFVSVRARAPLRNVTRALTICARPRAIGTRTCSVRVPAATRTVRIRWPLTNSVTLRIWRPTTVIRAVRDAQDEANDARAEAGDEAWTPATALAGGGGVAAGGARRRGRRRRGRRGRRRRRRRHGRRAVHLLLRERRSVARPRVAVDDPGRAPPRVRRHEMVAGQRERHVERPLAPTVRVQREIAARGGRAVDRDGVVHRVRTRREELEVEVRPRTRDLRGAGVRLRSGRHEERERGERGHDPDPGRHSPTTRGLPLSHGHYPTLLLFRPRFRRGRLTPLPAHPTDGLRPSVADAVELRFSAGHRRYGYPHRRSTVSILGSPGPGSPDLGIGLAP